MSSSPWNTPIRKYIGIHAARSANRFEALEPVRQGCTGASDPSHLVWRVD